MNPRIWCLDLEMNQPSQKIIQIGAVIGDLTTGEVVVEFSAIINPLESLNPFIIDLTKITQDEVDTGQDLLTATANLEHLVKKYHALKMPFVWGNGDLRLLKQRSGSVYFNSIHREMDIKVITQFLRLTQDMSMKGGLGSTITAMCDTFEGQPHNALHDAKNTFLLAHRVYKALKYRQAVFNRVP